MLTGPVRALWRWLTCRRMGRCPGCKTTVYADDSYVRYRGDYFHAEPCGQLRHRLQRRVRDRW